MRKTTNLIARVTGSLLLLALFGLASAVAQPPPDAPRTIEVDGHAMRVRTAGFEHLGAGQPVVVFESGAGTPLQNWGRVFTDVAAFAPVVAYDRVGIGGTAWDGEAPTPERVVARLHALLEALEAPPPYVLVGHSWGGPLIHYFAGHYPDEVAGLVYVDAPDLTRSRADHLAVFAEAGVADPEAASRAFIEAWQAFAAEAPPGIRAEQDVIRDLAFQREPEERGLRPVPEVPTAVLLAGQYEPPPPQVELPFDPRAYFEAELRQRVRERSASVLDRPEGLFVLATQAGHFLHGDDPALVTDAVRHVVFPDVRRQLRAALASGGGAALGETYRALVRRYPPERFDEGLLNTLGYELLQSGRVDDAVAVFELNVAAYPEAANPHDSLGDGYSAAGRMEDARASYARAVELADQTGHPGLPTFQANLERVSQPTSGN